MALFKKDVCVPFCVFSLTSTVTHFFENTYFRNIFERKWSRPFGFEIAVEKTEWKEILRDIAKRQAKMCDFVGCYLVSSTV